MPDTRVRVVGSGYTTFNYKGMPIAFMNQVQDLGQGTVGPTAVRAITPIGALRPVELVAQRVLAHGELHLSIVETWNENVWEQLAGLEGTDTIGDVFDRLRQEPSYVTCTKIIRPPGGRRVRGIMYNNCLVYGIDDSDTIEVAGLDVSKTIRIAYTHKTRI